jgi:hypothetical protein
MRPGPRPTALLLTVAAILVVGAIGLLAAVHAALTHRPAQPPRLAGLTERLREPFIPRSMSPGTSSGGTAVAPARLAGRLVVPLSDPAPPRLPSDGTPRGWTLREFSGRAAVDLLRAEPGMAVRLRTDHGAFALVREVVVDLAVTPVLSWQWRMERAPARGDVRDAAANDQAVQVYVIFPRWPAPMTRSEVIGYLWDTRAPVGTVVTHPRAPNVRMVVVESGTGHSGVWQRVSRNVQEDYRALFGRRPGQVGAVALMTDGDDTGSATEALVADLVFLDSSS